MTFVPTDEQQRRIELSRQALREALARDEHYSPEFIERCSAEIGADEASAPEPSPDFNSDLGVVGSALRALVQK